MPLVTQQQHRRLGGSDLNVSPIGLGCMSLSGVYGEADDTASEALIHHAIDCGVNHFDSSDMYGWGHNETVLGRALKARRKEVVLATKFGQVRREGQPNGVDGRAAYVIAACEASLKRLGVEVIDLYYQHRVDPTVPIEETVGAMGKLVARGKSARSACRKPIPTRSGGRTRRTRSPSCRPSFRCCIARRPKRRA